jgi:hypothetical protein
MSLMAVLMLGFFLGMRHATDADHVVAVTTIVARERSASAAMSIGALWGVGHTVTILVVGGAIILFGWVVPARLGLSMEMTVAAMLIVLGLANLSGAMGRIDEAARAARGAGAAMILGTGTTAGAPARWIHRAMGPRARPLIVGVVHGLAGSAAVALLVLATLSEPRWALLYLAVFGLGTVLGMALLTAAMSIPIMSVTKRHGSADALVRRVTGLASLGFGLFLAYQIGVVDGLFTGAASWSPR